MGMYTEFHFNSELKEQTPKEVINILMYMVGDLDTKPEDIPNDDLFETARWEYMLQCDSYYFDADTHSTLRWDEIGKSYYLNIRCNLKNYDSEIEKFIKWTSPYLNKYKGEFLGFYRYEEDEEPTLVYQEVDEDE
jgi:hypothetical protein